MNEKVRSSCAGKKTDGQHDPEYVKGRRIARRERELRRKGGQASGENGQ